MDQKDLVILRKLEVAQSRNEPSPTITEMAQASQLSVGAVHARLKSLVKQGLIAEPKRARQPRSYVITGTGVQLLEDEATSIRPFVVGNRSGQWPPR